MLVAAGSRAEGPGEDERLLSCGRARDRLLRAALAGGSAGKANAKPCSSSQIRFTRNSPQTAGKAPRYPPQRTKLILHKAIASRLGARQRCIS